MKTREQMLAALDALQEVCQQHGVALLGVCNAEGIYGEIELRDAADLSESEQARLAEPRLSKPEMVLVLGIGSPASSYQPSSWKVDQTSLKAAREIMTEMQRTHVGGNVQLMAKVQCVVNAALIQERKAYITECIDFSHHFPAGSSERNVLQRVAIRLDMRTDAMTLEKNDDAWKPIETAPKDGTEVFVGVDTASVWIARNARFVRADEWLPGEPGDTDGWWSYRNSVSQEKLEGIHEPTHWCPMPVPPDSY